MKLFPHTDSIKQFISRHWLSLIAVQAAILLGLGYLAGGGFGRANGAGDATAGHGTDTASHKAHGESASMWTCSMHPQIRSGSPGKCPICGMDLIPVARSTGGLRTLTVSPEAKALMNIETAPVERRYVTHAIRMVGKVDYDETKLGSITAWVPGRLDRLYVDYTGVEVKQGDHMVYIFSEQLYAAQQELIEALKSSRAPRNGRDFFNTGGVDLLAAAREKLRLLGLTPEQIADIEKREKPSDHLTIYAKVGGIVIEKLKQEGDRVALGDRIYTIADLSQVWVHLDAYESDLAWVRYGQDVTITTEAYPGEEFHGRIAFIQPVLNDKTRTVKVRVNVPNAQGKLKPDMFVHAVVRPKVAAAGRVMDPGLAGKWISPMHPEIVKDAPGKCDICGMPLVRAESLGYVTPDTDERKPPLVIPYSAALVTGRRAIVYVELPEIPQGVETAFQGVAGALEQADMEAVRKAFAVFGNVLDRPYAQGGTSYARQLWNRFADEIAEHVLQGKRASAVDDAVDIFSRLEAVMVRVREEFAPLGQPTFEGREIVLGPRAGNYYLVRHGLEEGELVVTKGNFKIDAEIQIQAKPSMMTPEGGGGGGHDHGHGEGAVAKKAEHEHAGHAMALPSAFLRQLRKLEAAYQQVADAVEQKDLGKVTAAFAQFGEVLDAVDGTQLSGHARMQWQEFAMLLGNDAVEGGDVDQRAEADRVFLLLKGHMRRLREQLGVVPGQKPPVEHIAVSPEFQAELAAVWERYLAMQKELAADEFQNARQMLAGFETAVAAVDNSLVADRALDVWQHEKSGLLKLIAALKAAKDVQAFRTQFKPLSEEIGVLAKSFGFGEPGPVYELHCPMAFENKGAVWYQDSHQVRNPYYGSSMLKCADRVVKVVRDEPGGTSTGDTHQHE